MLAIMENFQDEAGGIAVPQVLVEFGAPARLGPVAAPETPKGARAPSGWVSVLRTGSPHTPCRQAGGSAAITSNEGSTAAERPMLAACGQSCLGVVLALGGASALVAFAAGAVFRYVADGNAKRAGTLGLLVGAVGLVGGDVRLRLVGELVVERVFVRFVRRRAPPGAQLDPLRRRAPRGAE